MFWKSRSQQEKKVGAKPYVLHQNKFQTDKMMLKCTKQNHESPKTITGEIFKIISKWEKAF